MLDTELVKGEPLDIPLKKSKLDEYAAAYLYAAATMDPLYIHAAIYEPWTNRQLSAFRPVPNMFAKDSKIRHTLPSSLGLNRYKEPPVLQHPERVVPMSESERFERSFQPNVALAPPMQRKHKYATKDSSEVPVKVEEQYVMNSPHKDVLANPPLDECPRVPGDMSPVTTVISSKECYTTNSTNNNNSNSNQNNHHQHQQHQHHHHHHHESKPAIQCVTMKTEPESAADRTHSAIVDSTVSVVQTANLMNNPRYNSEIELSTDTDDSLSDMSSDNLRKISDVQRVADALGDVPNVTRELVLDIVRHIAKEHSHVIQQCQEKDERIRELEQKLRDLQNNIIKSSGERITNVVHLADSVSHSEYDVTSSRAEIPGDECQHIINNSDDSTNNDPVEVHCVTSCAAGSSTTDRLHSDNDSVLIVIANEDRKPSLPLSLPVENGSSNDTDTTATTSTSTATVIATVPTPCTTSSTSSSTSSSSSTTTTSSTSSSSEAEGMCTGEAVIKDEPE